MHNWKEEVMIDPKLDVHCDKFIEMMTELKCMWDGHLCHVIVKNHSIELKSIETRRAQYEPCTAGPRAREFERSEFDMMVKVGVIERLEM